VNTLVYRALPYNYVICDAFRSEVCARCFKFTGGRSKWKIRSEKGRRWFCSPDCHEESRQEPGSDLAETWLQKLDDEVNIRKKRRQRNEAKNQARVVSEVPLTDDGKRIGSGKGNLEKLSKEERRELKLKAASEQASIEANNEAESDEEYLNFEALAIASDEQTSANGSRPKVSTDEHTEPLKISPALLARATADEELSLITSWMACWEDPSPKYALAEDHVPLDDELDIARSVLHALCKRAAEMDATDSASFVDVDPPADLPDDQPTFGQYLWLQNCERDYYLSVLRQTNSGPKRIELPEAIHRDLRAFRFILLFLPETIWRIDPLDPSMSTPGNVFRSIIYRERANTFGIWEPTDEAPETGRSTSSPESEILGSSVYPTASFFNNSCDPTMYRIQTGRAIEFFTRRDVREGEELTITYGEMSDSVEGRRSKLAKEYFFWCLCSRCTEQAGEV